MKIHQVKSTNTKDFQKEVPPLTLESDDEDEGAIDATETGVFKLHSDPADANSPKYTFTMAYANGKQSLRFHLKWWQQCKKVIVGMRITTGPAMYGMVERMCSGQVWTDFAKAVQQQQEAARADLAQRNWNQFPRLANETEDQWNDRRQLAYENDMNAALPPCTVVMIDEGFKYVIKQVSPYQTLEKQKRFMRRKMRKPAGMTVRQYVTCLHRINNEELPLLYPHNPNQRLPIDELVDIVWYGIPKSWTKEMDKQNFDPFRNHDLEGLVDFCERMEACEDGGPTDPKHTNKKKDTKKSKTSTSGNKAKEGDKWCEYHESSTHSTAECAVMKALKAKKGVKPNGDKKDNKTNKKDWKKKSDDAKTFTKKELNNLVKKASDKAASKAVTKTVNKTKDTRKSNAKRKAQDSDDDSAGSLNMLEQEMQEVDEQLAAFDFDLNEKELEDGEIDV